MRSFDERSLERQRRHMEGMSKATPAPGEGAAAATPPPEDLPEDRLVAVVVDIAEDGTATVLVGADEVEFVFPCSVLPDEGRVGQQVYVVQREGRLEVIGERPVHKAEPGVSVEERMERGVLRRRLGDDGS